MRLSKSFGAALIVGLDFFGASFEASFGASCGAAIGAAFGAALGGAFEASFGAIITRQHHYNDEDVSSSRVRKHN